MKPNRKLVKREFKGPYLPLISQETVKQLAAQLKLEKK